MKALPVLSNSLLGLGVEVGAKAVFVLPAAEYVGDDAGDEVLIVVRDRS